MKVGIWGCGGFVGNTCYRAFAKDWFQHEIYGYDINPEKTIHAKKDVLSCDLIFVCVPTPMVEETGAAYIGIVEEVVFEIRENNKEATIVIKSTVPPGTTEVLNKEFGGNICFNPEFLTEANAYKDFIDLPYQIIGIPKSDVNSLKDNIFDFFNDLGSSGIIKGGKYKDQIVVFSTEAEMIKYTRNCYLATRLSYFNEIKQICDKVDADYEVVKDFAGFDNRVGTHYNTVNPENPGFGKSCLPKDLNALKSLGKAVDVKTTMLDAVWDKNLEVRKYRDWEDMEKAVKK